IEMPCRLGETHSVWWSGCIEHDEGERQVRGLMIADERRVQRHVLALPLDVAGCAGVLHDCARYMELARHDAHARGTACSGARGEQFLNVRLRLADDRRASRLEDAC